MSLYEFQFFDAAGGRPTLDFANCRDDEEAARDAMAQLEFHRSCVGVEVYQEDRLVTRLERPRRPGDVAAGPSMEAG